MFKIFLLYSHFSCQKQGGVVCQTIDCATVELEPLRVNLRFNLSIQAQNINSLGEGLCMFIMKTDTKSQVHAEQSATALTII